MRERIDKIKSLLEEAANSATMDTASFGYENDKIEIKHLQWDDERRGKVGEVIHPTDYVKRITKLHHNSWIIRPIKKAIAELETIRAEVYPADAELDQLRAENTEMRKLLSHRVEADDLSAANESLIELRQENENMKAEISGVISLYKTEKLPVFFEGLRAFVSPSAPQFEEVTEKGFINLENGAVRHVIGTHLANFDESKWADCTITYQRPILVKKKRRAEIPADGVSPPNGGRYVDGTKFYREWEE